MVDEKESNVVVCPDDWRVVELIEQWGRVKKKWETVRRAKGKSWKREEEEEARKATLASRFSCTRAVLTKKKKL